MTDASKKDTENPATGDKDDDAIVQPNSMNPHVLPDSMNPHADPDSMNPHGEPKKDESEQTTAE